MATPLTKSLPNGLAQVEQDIARACKEARRERASVTLIAVSKTFEATAISPVIDAGQRVFGENRVQEFATKANALRDLAGAEWHMIGHLQSNKSSKAAELFGHVDSVDSIRLAEKLNAAASQLGKKIPVLVEINIGEQAKNGVAPGSAELENLLNAAAEFSSLGFRGLMTVPPYNDDPKQSRPYFRKMRELFNQIAQRSLASIRMEVLSMGMSHDFEVAIEEGSTCVRVGTAIFGARRI